MHKLCRHEVIEGVMRRGLCDLTQETLARTIPAISHALEAASPRAPVVCRR